MKDFYLNLVVIFIFVGLFFIILNKFEVSNTQSMQEFLFNSGYPNTELIGVNSWNNTALFKTVGGDTLEVITTEDGFLICR